jgi:hypothetical protein
LRGGFPDILSTANVSTTRRIPREVCLSRDEIVKTGTGAAEKDGPKDPEMDEG